MGIVYEAVQLSLGRRVALKVLPFAASLHPTHLSRFKTEAQAVAPLQHQNIVPVYAVGCERGVHYYAMQFIEGRTLASLIAESRPGSGRRGSETTVSFPAPPDSPVASWTEGPWQSAAFVRTAARLGLQAAEALEHAHQFGIIHRDVKPANLIVDVRHNLWVTDFGLARVPRDAGLTLTGDLVGTLRYMSPEQAGGRPGQVDHRTDIYSLGATLYELLTLQPIFPGPDRGALLRQIALDEPAPIRRLNRAVPTELAVIVHKALAKAPEERYASAQELADDLRRFLEDKPIKARRPTLRQRLRRWTRRHRSVVLTGVLALGMLLVMAVAGLLISNALIARERDQTRQAERAAQQRLFQTLVVQAQASRNSGRLLGRHEAQTALEEATRLGAWLGLTRQERLQLRNEVIACLSLPDLRTRRDWEGFPRGSRALAFDPDLRRYARGDDRGTISIRSLADDRELDRLETDPSDTTCLLWTRFSLNGMYLAVRSDRDGNPHLSVWDLRTHTAVIEVGAGVAADFTPDSRQVLIGCRDGSIRAESLDSGRAGRGRTFRPPGLEHSSVYVAINPRGGDLLAYHLRGNEIQFLDFEDGAQRARLGVPTGVNHAAWLPQGRGVALACGRVIHLYDLETSRPRLSLFGHQEECTYLATDPPGSVLASHVQDDTTRLWDLKEGRQIFSIPDAVLPHFGADGRSLALRQGTRLSILERGQGREYLRLYSRISGQGIGALIYQNCENILIVGGQGGLCGWDLASGQDLWSSAGFDVKSLMWDTDGTHLVVAGRSGFQRRGFEGEPAHSPSRLRPGAAEPLSVSGVPKVIGIGSASRDGTTTALVAGREGAVVLDADLNIQARLRGQLFTWSTATSLEGRWVATGTWHGREILIWDARSGQVVYRIPQRPGGCSTVAFSPDGRWLAIGLGGEYELREAGSWRLARRIERRTGNEDAAPGGMDFSPDGRMLAVAGGLQDVWLLDPITAEPFATLTTPDPGILTRLRFHPDGHVLAAATSGGVVHVWDLPALRSRLADLGLDRERPAGSPEDRAADPAGSASR
jgi:WD40 repeat protein